MVGDRVDRSTPRSEMGDVEEDVEYEVEEEDVEEDVD